MSTQTLTLPAWVQPVGKGNQTVYRIRPLFQLRPETEHRRFERAITLFSREIRQYLQYTNSNRNELDSILWLGFHPDLTHQTIPLQFRSGSREVNGNFSVVTYELQGQKIVCLPGVDNHMFIAHKDESGKVRLAEQTEAVLQDLFRNKRHKFGKDWNPEETYAKSGEFITTVDVSVSIKPASFPFACSCFPQASSLLGGGDVFDGAEEIEKVAQDLNQLYPYELQRAYSQSHLVSQIQQLLFQKENVPLVLIGSLGVGKTTLLHEVVYQHMEQHQKKEFFRVEKVWHLDPVRVIAGMSIVGMWQKRFEAILQHAIHRLDDHGKKTDKIFIDNPVALLRVGKSSGSNLHLGALLKSYLEQQELQVILEATPEEWGLLQELDRNFTDLFTIIRVSPTTPEQTARIAVYCRAQLEQEHACQIENLALQQIFTLQRSFLHHKSLPGGVIDLMTQITTKYRHQKITAQDVMTEFGASFQLNHHMFDRSIRLDAKEVRSFMEQRLIGQPEAVDSLVDTVHLIKSGLNDRNKPVSAFLFVGPTGVGKTQAAKVLTQYLFRSEDSMIRFDMNEFIEPHAVTRLIGDLHQPEGQLTGRVRHRPFCVLLLDEIEKAHNKVHDLLLQLLGEGRLTDALGRTVNFTNCIVIMTSNVGAREAGKVVGFGDKTTQAAGQYQKAMRSIFRPEFINRIDRVITFAKLRLEDVMGIARLQMEELLQREGFLRRTTILSVSPDALEQVAQRGFDPELGGRALKRAIEKELTVLAAEQMVQIDANHPILFEIGAQAGQLQPRITPLLPLPASTSWQAPKPPPHHTLQSSLQQLLLLTEQTIEDINHAIDQQKILETSDSTNPGEIYLFRERVLDLKHELQELFWDMKVPLSENAPGYKTALKKTSERWGVPVHNIRDYMSYLHLVEFLHDMQTTAIKAMERSQTEYLQFFLQLAYHRFFAQSILSFQQSRVFLHIESLVKARGQLQIAHLSQEYRNTLTDLGFPPHIHEKQDKTACTLFLQGPRLDTLLQGEHGIHMYYSAFQPPVPLQVTVGILPPDVSEESFAHQLFYPESSTPQTSAASAHDPLPPQVTQPQPSSPTPNHSGHSSDRLNHSSDHFVLRLYTLRSLQSHDAKNGTITDLRTGWINQLDLNTADWLLLFYAGLPKEERISLECIDISDTQKGH